MNSSIESAYNRISLNFLHKSEDFKKRLIQNYILFLQIRNYEKTCSPSDTVDELWHSHVLDTKGYNNYCMKEFGSFVHHDPNDSLDQCARLKRLERTVAYIKNYIREGKTFVENVDNEIWNVEKCCICSVLNYVEQLNSYSTCSRCDEMINNNTNKCNDMDTFQIFIKVLTGRTIVLNVSDETTIYHIAKQLYDKNHASSMHMSMIFAGRQLNFIDTIEKSKIKKESSIHMVLNLSGC